MELLELPWGVEAVEKSVGWRRSRRRRGVEGYAERIHVRRSFPEEQLLLHYMKPVVR